MVESWVIGGLSRFATASDFNLVHFSGESLKSGRHGRF